MLEAAYGEREGSPLSGEQLTAIKPLVKSFETGQMSADAFAAALLKAIRLPLTKGMLLRTFKGWVRGLYPGAADLLRRLRPQYTVACLSNTNPIHWPVIRDDFGLGELLDHAFVSHETGLHKPDPAAFTHVCEAVQLPGQAILFFDDRQENIDAAQAAGLQAVLADGVQGVEAALAAMAR